MFGNANRFKTKNEAMNRRILTWTCMHCTEQHKHTKPKYCRVCERSAFYYFASQAEARRFAALNMLQNVNEIKELRVQHRFPIRVKNKSTGKPEEIFKYISDFTYRNKEGKFIVEDVKGSLNEKSFDNVFKLKRKLVEAIYGIKITIVKG